MSFLQSLQTKIICTLLLILCSCTVALCQQPAYFMMGEEQFKGVQIYDVIQDTSFNYWFATNEGLYLYDYKSYRKINCEQAKSNSVFNFVSDGKGALYCHNLNNQIFKVEKQKCTVLYELTPEESYQDVSLSVGNNGHLLVACRKLIEIEKSGKVTQKLDLPRALGQPFKAADQTIVFHCSNTDSLLFCRDGVCEYSRLKLEKEAFGKVFNFKIFNTRKGVMALELKSQKLQMLDLKLMTMTEGAQNKHFARSQSVRVYDIGGETWIAGTLPGVTRLEQENMTDDVTVMYPNFFISDVYKDHEGNMLFSTFDKGVLVVTDLNVPDVIAPFEDDHVCSFYPEDGLGLFMGTSRGNIFRWRNNQLEHINKSGKRQIEGLYSSKKSKWMVFDDGHIRAMTKKGGTSVEVVASSLKSAVFVSDKSFYFGTNIGVGHCEWDGSNKIQIKWLDAIKSRIYALAYDSASAKLYAASVKGLYVLDQSGNTSVVEYRGKTLIANYLYLSKSVLYICSKEHGVLCMKGTAAPIPFLDSTFTQTQSVLKLLVHKGRFYVKTSNGLFQTDAFGKSIQSVHSRYGLAQKRIIDFCFSNDTLWVSHYGGVQAIDLSHHARTLGVPPLRVSEIFVNNQPTTLAELKDLSSNQRKVQFELISPTLGLQHSVQYYYKLTGYESNWNIAEHDEHSVVYNALSPGSYVFEAKILCNGVFGPVQHIKFNIASPFYQRWWFILLMVVLFLGAVYGVYSYQMRRLQQKSELQNAINSMKLTAIQSQMNPHFIFNALNSIQDLVLRGDVDNSYNYINKFSNLVRRTLDYSDKEFIDFEEEMKLIELYLALEKLRFKEQLTYSIDIGNVEDVMVPPMLIQPFIENALLHGLLHKEGPKRLQIEFKLDDVLQCTITDNGVGRDKAKKIRERQQLEHDSFSGKAIKKRFEILEKHFGESLGFHYEDLSQDGVPMGTRVVLKIPVKRLF